MNNTRVCCYLLYGLGGRAWSAGIADALGPKLRVIPGVWCPPTYQWYDWQSIINNVWMHSEDSKFVVAGHSLGANVIGWIASGIAPRKLSLAVGYDPSIWYPVAPIPANVEKTILFHGVNWLNPIGHALYTGNNIIEYDTNDLHTDIDDDNGLHGITVNAVKALS